MKNDLVSLEAVSLETVQQLLAEAKQIKASSKAQVNHLNQPLHFSANGYGSKLAGKTLLSLFEKPSFRTALSFEVAMTQLGGQAVTMHAQTLPLGKKESIEDTARVASRYIDFIMARLYEHEQLVSLAKHATVPVINGLTNKFHPVQALSDLLTIREKKGGFKGLKLAYFGDGNNNVTHSLLLASALVGIDIVVACPKQYAPQEDVVALAEKKAKGSTVTVTQDAASAAIDTDIVYTDSWMSYHITESIDKRVSTLRSYQVNAKLMRQAKPDAIFMNCLPAQRGFEQTAEVIDGPQSVVFDQAENRLHMQKAILLWAGGLL